MNRILILTLLAAISLNVAAQKEITELRLKNFDVTIIPSDLFSYEYDKSEKVEISIKENKITIEFEDQEIQDEKQGFFSKLVSGKSYKRRIPITIYAKGITSLELQNSALEYNETIKLPGDFKVYLSEDSNLKLTNVEVKNLWLNASSSSEIDIENSSSAKLKINLSSSAKLKIRQAVSENAEVNLSSSARMSTHQMELEGNMQMNMSSSSSAQLGAKATKVDLSLSSSVSLGMNIVADDLQVKSSSSATAVLSGDAKSFNGVATSSGKIDAGRLMAESIQTKNNSGGKIIAPIKKNK